jgi:hypothetical protein
MKVKSRQALSDIDAIDPAHAPGAGAHEPVGDMTSTLAAYLAFGFGVFGSRVPS